MVLESNADNLKSLVRFYENLVADECFPDPDRKDCQRSAKRFAAQVNELIYDINTQSRRAGVLAKIVADRKVIVRTPKAHTSIPSK
jgi:hypothetical protein